MRIEELLFSNEKNYSPKISVYLDEVKESDRKEIAGMLRGLMCSIEGWAVISGFTNEKFDTQQCEYPTYAL